ncbi:hypothetical protein Tco_1044646 [Tanacetum coccineum]|uniref:Uncharacterized protein n=1 Tax=Tanacetum coccineum TaxID=301880 RepID=A0ABQ5GRR5_9ASTR
MDKCKTGLGYNAVPPPYTGHFMPPKPDLVYPSLDDFVDVNESVVEKPTVESNEPKTARKENGAPIIEDWVSERSDFEMFNKACHVCGSFDHLKNDCNNWYNNGRFAKLVWTDVERVNKLTHPSPKRNMVPRTVLTKSGSISLNTARPVNAVQPRTTVNTVKRTRVNTARLKVVLSAIKGNKGNAVKASAWKSTIMKKLMEDLLPLEVIPKKGKLLGKMCDKKNNVLFTDTECIVLSPDFKTNEPKTARKEDGAPIIKDWVSESEEEDVPKIKTVEMFNKPSFAKTNFVKSTKQVKSPRNTSVDKNRQNSPSPKGNKRN